MLSMAQDSTDDATGNGGGNGGGGDGFDFAPFEQILETLDSLLESLFESVPRIALALVVLALFWFVGRLLRRVLEPRLARLRTKSFGQVFATLTYIGVVLIGFIVAVPIAFPSVNAVTMLSGLGLLGVAAGFAFQDILSNLLSGLLLILRQPFEAGDQIEVNGIAGTVEVITIRETRLRTFDGFVVFIPNKDVYVNAIHVQTARAMVRTSLVVGVEYDTDLALARRTALQTLRDLDGVVDDPAPEALYVDFGASSINLDLRYWTGSREAERRRVQDLVVEHIKAAFDREGVEIPFDIVTLDTSAAFEQAVGSGGNSQAASR